MRSADVQKINAVADFAVSVYRSDDLFVETGKTREEAVLGIAADSVMQAKKPGVLGPELRLRLEAMDEEYAKILTRIDRIVTGSKASDLIFDNDPTPVIFQQPCKI